MTKNDQLAREDGDAEVLHNIPGLALFVYSVVFINLVAGETIDPTPILLEPNGPQVGTVFSFPLIGEVGSLGFLLLYLVGALGAIGIEVIVRD